MKKFTMIAALVLFVATFSVPATAAVVPATTPVEQTDDDPKAKEEKEKKDGECTKAEKKECSKKDKDSCSK